MSLQAKAEIEDPLGLYIHVPFCATTCDFCAFYQHAPNRSDIEQYLETMQQALLANRPDRHVDTVFWGGGTPGLLTAKDLKKLGSSMLSVLEKPPSEWTIEMAPSTIKPDKIKTLRDLGVTRLSLGVQSFDDTLLERLGRQHSRKQVHRAIETVQEAGFENFNLDLIFALPGQSFEDWARDLEEAISFNPAHISTYCLTFEEDTKLWARLQKGQVHRRSEEDEATFYECTSTYLASVGLEQYETSNYARPGYECLHNLHTWQMYEWIGYGPSASSQWKQRRFTETASLKEWTEAIRESRPNYSEEVELNDTILASDALTFGLRMNAGVNPRELQRRFPEGPWDAFEKLIHTFADEGLAELSSENWALSPRGRLLADAIGGEILDCSLALPR
jgi:oxygen-independent coproporphyrinogen-3 oxidase